MRDLKGRKYFSNMIFEFSGSLHEKCIVSPQAQSYCWGESISKICFIVYIEITRSDGWKIKNNECLVRLVIRRSYRTLIYLKSMAQPFLSMVSNDDGLFMVEIGAH